LVRAETPSPLRLIPAEADVVAQVPNPRRVAETASGLELFREFQGCSAIKEALDSTRVRRFRQLVAYFEKEMGRPWPELLDDLAGGGVAMGASFASEPPLTLLVVQGRDAKTMQRFVKLAREVFEQELARGESKDKPVVSKYEGVEVLQVGEDFHAAVAGSALLIANRPAALHRGLDLHLGKGKGSAQADVAATTSVLPDQPLATVFLNMVHVRKFPQAAELYKSPRNDATLTTLFGGLLDVLGRAPFVVAALTHGPEGLALTVRIPKGRVGMGPDRALNVPPDGQPGSRPLLEPKGVVNSISFFYDLARVWSDRDTLYTPKNAKALVKVDNDSGKYLSNLQMSKLFAQVGTYHRIVSTSPSTASERTQRTGPFAVVSEIREPESFGKSIETVLRGAALLALTQVKLKSFEEKVGGATIVGWNFVGGKQPNEALNDFPFEDFSPCLCMVGNQFVVSSTVELCRELVGILEAEAKASPTGSAATNRTCFYGAGLADLLEPRSGQLIAQAVLDRALPAEIATREVKAALAWLRKQGVLEIRTDYQAERLQYDIRLLPGRSADDKHP
jgi:hypothetical protein